MRVTGLIAAGAVIDLGAPSTKAITTAVRARKQRRTDGSEVNFLEQVADAVDARAGKQFVANFEDYLHAVETLQSLSWARDPKTPWPSVPVVAAFDPKLDDRWFDRGLLLQAEQDLIDEVAGVILNYMRGFDPVAHPWFTDFWQRAVAKAHWDLATTNYDDSVERCLPRGTWQDGFVPLDPGVNRFDPQVLWGGGLSRLLHLHGSVHYGYPRFANPNRFVFEDDHEDLYKFDDPAEARKTWFGRSTNKAQSRDYATAGPIITGLRKTDKTMYYPYDCFQAGFQEAVRTSPRLFVAGYSFGDQHLNRVLQRMTRLHGRNRRIVLVTYFPNPDRWCHDPSVMDWPDNHETFEFIAKSFCEADPFPNSFHNPLVSKDGTTQVYLQGMREALQNHGQAIIDFLTS